MRAMARARDFAGGVSLHSGAANIGWVWNWTVDERAAEEALLAELAEDYAAACTAPAFWTTNGGDWYVTHGESTDWNYGATGALDFTVELTELKSPAEDEIPTYVGWHLDALLAFLARLPDREAEVTDAVTGEPIPARVWGDGVGDGWTGPDGRYARWGVAQGLVAWAPGYAEASLGEPLVPVSLVDASPRLVSRGEGEIDFPGTGVLSMPGEDDVSFDGVVDPAALAPGAWSITTDAGTAPRALFVGEVDDRVAITGVSVEGGLLTLEGRGFGEGAEAWSLGGPARALHPLTRVSEEPLAFALPDGDSDVLLWTSGAWLSALDVRDAPVVDVDAPTWEGEYPEDEEREAAERSIFAPGGCAGSTGWVGALLWFGRRRKGGRGVHPQQIRAHQR
jgi:hypothetical protein